MPLLNYNTHTLKSLIKKGKETVGEQINRDPQIVIVKITFEQENSEVLFKRVLGGK